MVFTGELDHSLDTSTVVESEEADALGLMTRWVGEDEEFRGQQELIRQIVEGARRTWAGRKGRHFTVRGRDGSVLGMTTLFSDGAIAQVEDVYVAPEARGRGFGRVLVTHAVRQALEARHELVFIAADHEDWPKDLYAKVGFTPVAQVWSFHRPAPVA
jgi:GNAT superfamily N-acetyltransferase